MSWNVEFLEEAKKDMKRLDHSAQIQVLKGIQKVAQNPVSVNAGNDGQGHADPFRDLILGQASVINRKQTYDCSPRLSVVKWTL